MVINQRPKANDGKAQIRSRELVFQQDTEVLEFKGPTQLNHVDGTNAASTGCEVDVEPGI